MSIWGRHYNSPDYLVAKTTRSSVTRRISFFTVERFVIIIIFFFINHHPSSYINSIHIIYILHLPSKASLDLQGVRILHRHLRVTSFGDLRQGPRDGNRITLEHSQKHPFGTQPFWHSCETQNATSHQTTASRVPKQCLYQKKVPMRNVVLIGLPFTCDEILPITCDEIVALHFCRSLGTKCL